MVSGNRLKCDCHISWIYSLRNETVNEDFKKSLEELTCLSSESKPEVSTISVSTEKPQEDQPYSADTDSAQYGDEEVDYEEDVSSLDYDDEEGGPPRQKIFDIPIENLPCPEMQKASTEIAAKSSMSFLPEASSSNFNSAQRFRISFFFVICLAALVL